MPILAQNLSLEIIGKDSLETKTIDSLSYQKTFKDFKSLSLELESFMNRLQKIGYIESELISNDKTNDSVYHSEIHLNRQFYTIYIYTLKNSLPLELIKAVSNEFTDSYFSLPIQQVDETLNFLNSELGNQGYPFTSLQLINITKRDEQTLRAEISLETGQSRTLDEILVKGFAEFPSSFIKRYLKLKPGLVFNLQEIEERTEALNNLVFANQIKSPEVLFTKDSTSVYLYLEKNRSNNFDGFLGFGSNESSGKLEFDGYLNLALRNNLNSGEEFYLTYKSDENEQRTFDARLELPYIFGSPIGTHLNLNIFKKDSTFGTVNQKFGLFYQINSKHRIQAEVLNIKSNSLLDSSIEYVEDFTSNFYNFKYNYQIINVNDFLFPIKSKLEIDLGTGRRDESDLKMDQQLFRFKASNIFKLNAKNSIYLNIDGSGLFSDNYLNNELFRFGGINSIRGFEENSIPASLYGLLNTEYRITLNNSIFVHSIFDAAYFENKIDNLKQKLFGFGFGFGIITKAGLLKMNYANGKNEGSNIQLSNSKIHLSLKTLF